MQEYGFSLTRVIPNKDKIVDSDLTQHNTCQRKPCCQGKPCCQRKPCCQGKPCCRLFYAVESFISQKITEKLNIEKIFIINENKGLWIRYVNVLQYFLVFLKTT